MAPRLRKTNEKRRRRRWAAPFVLTLALSPLSQTTACSSKDKPETRTHNPPMPALVSDAAVEAKKPPPAGAKDAGPSPSNQFARVYKLDNGECRWAFPSGCEPNEKCNPPPPAKIECPKYLPEKGARGVKNADGTCSIWISPNCPENADGVAPPCNPPPPQNVDCPQ